MAVLAASNLWWYTARSSGIVAWGMLTASVLVGLALSTRALGRRPKANWLLDLHRFLAAAAVVFTGTHLLALVADSYLQFGLVQLLVPSASDYRPGAVAWGIVSLYLLVAVEVTSLLRRRLSNRTWRAVHYLSFPLYLFATVHAITAGTDGDAVGLRVLLILSTGVITGLSALRVYQADEHDILRRPPVG